MSYCGDWVAEVMAGIGRLWKGEGWHGEAMMTREERKKRCGERGLQLVGQGCDIGWLKERERGKGKAGVAERSETMRVIVGGLEEEREGEGWCGRLELQRRGGSWLARGAGKEAGCGYGK
ncbi:hypothetical protein OIU74_003844 [Salix koriyanagi]|uniref:Uncharacterized protein n=1 Tax=Salix koriyanagi TaxID=2511006 RepID=A0A9Q0ZLM0_9ROSI|nr:hypothetical protein OIU74_003844 [Salix koriyanagi]